MTDPIDSAPRPPFADAFRPSSSRRTVLKAAGLVALVGGGGATLAACSPDTTSAPAGSAEPSAPASSSSAPSSSAPSSSSPSASSAAPSASKSAPAPSGPSVDVAEVPVGGGFIMPDADFVVTQPTKGDYKAFSKICTHQGCPVKQIVDKEIVCNCHNSHFSITDGSVLRGPARKSLPEAKVTVSGDSIVVTE